MHATAILNKQMSKKKNKRQKEKVVYYDDNSTIADMAPVDEARRKKYEQPKKKNSTFKEKWKTYWSAVKMMFLPMCIVLLVLAILFTLIMIVH